MPKRPYDGKTGIDHDLVSDYCHEDWDPQYQLRAKHNEHYTSPRDEPGYRSRPSSYSSASSDYISRAAYSKSDYIDPMSQSRRQAEHRRTSRSSRYPTADYISPLLEPRDDYIAPKKHDTHHRRPLKSCFKRRQEGSFDGSAYELWDSAPSPHIDHRPERDPTASDQGYSYSYSRKQHQEHLPESLGYFRAYGTQPDHRSVDRHSNDSTNTRHTYSQQPSIRQKSRSNSPSRGSDVESMASDHKRKRHLRYHSPSPELTYGSDFETLVDSSESDNDEEERPIRRRRNTSNSDIVSLHHSPSPSPLRPDPFSRNHSPPKTRPRSQSSSYANSDIASLPHSSSRSSSRVHFHKTPPPRSQSRRSSPAGSDIESTRYASDFEWCGSDCVDRGAREDRIGSDVCSVGSRRGSGSEGEWDYEDGVGLGSEGDSDED
ncbi:hypothetical protein EK21DRAFT_93509 [Setomelanomma holmii]|uniref:Uncharacterized protein n=1 Tax=Setomelanomma holmii TaxID=210430 RepID=A0A9P4GZP8_9PLEO|nr:hypothetical protein EK21DRAFT_93509 [Setomelanomma holmii]